MFDRIVMGQNTTEYVPYEKTVTVNRAPTDESIKLYEEMKAKAYGSLLQTISINDNELSCAAQIWRDMHSDKIIMAWRFLLNGKEYKGETDVEVWPLKDRHAVLDKIYESVAGKIALNLISGIDRQQFKFSGI